jgi:hypothetical protein
MTRLNDGKFSFVSESDLLRSICLAASLCVFSVSVTGCLEPGGITSSPSGSASNTVSIPSGVKGFEVILKSGASGSFTGSIPTNGTAVGTGLAAVQLFDPKDGTTVLANGTSDANWPAWLNWVTIGLSGTNNASAPNPNCATFASATEQTQANCSLGGNTVNCGANENQFRVSEVDCGYGAPGTATGNGGPNDGVYIQAYFNRAYLGSTENIMMVVNYISSTFNPGASANPNPAPTTPSCFSGGAFSPSSCADFTWDVFMKHSPTEVVQPFMMFVPPIFNYLSATAQNTTGNTNATKQFIIPFSGDQTLNTIQLSRINSLLSSSPSTNTTTYLDACDAGVIRTSTGANSPLCAGIIFNSITFFRI